MRTRVMLIAIAASTISSASFAQDNACLTEALESYTRLKFAALAEAAAQPLLSPETVVGLRRMEEAYCYRVAYCMSGNPNADKSRAIPYAAEFSRCLRAEAVKQ